jgi:signal transduction histidine kinase
MRQVLGRLTAAATTWPVDAILIALTLAWLLVAAAATTGLGHRPLELVVILPLAATIALRRTRPAAAALLASAALLMTLPLGLTDLTGNWLVLPVCWTAFLLCFALGTSTGLLVGLLGTALIAASLQVSAGPFSPIEVMITLGPWLAGRLMRSHRALTDQLQARNTELAAEQDRFARESVRYERARISRELHDIVAHSLSVMVVQASAGQRIADTDRNGMAEALMSVAEAAAQAEAEIGRLVDLLRGDVPPAGSPNLQMIDELVRRAATTGLTVTCRFSGDCELPPAASEAAYRVVQEALTNALKHAPGAPVTVTVATEEGSVVVCVQNAPPARPATALATSGGQVGLAAMRERVAACGGSLEAGPVLAGGWQVRALLPALARQRTAAMLRAAR